MRRLVKSNNLKIELRSSIVAAVIATLAACGADKNPDDPKNALQKALTVADFVDQVVQLNAEYLSAPPYAAADLKYGERIAMQCRACHTLEADGATLLGPNLNGLFGRPAAASADFSYSPALSSVDIVWTPAALDAWLAEPSRFLPGNRMAFAGIRDPADRNALIAYLLMKTQKASDSGAESE